MSKFLKVLAGLGVAAAATGVAISLSKKKTEENDDLQEEFDVCDNCQSQDCDNCKCSDCNEDNCSECSYAKHASDNSDNYTEEEAEFIKAITDTYGFEDKPEIDLKKTVDSAINGLLHGVMNASIKVGSFCAKISNVTADELKKRKYPELYKESMKDDDLFCEYEHETDPDSEYYKRYYNASYTDDTDDNSNDDSQKQEFDFSVIDDPNIYYGQDHDDPISDEDYDENASE